MKKILENKWVRLILNVVIFAIMAMIIFPLLDFIWSLFTNNTFVYSFKNHIRDPIIFGALLGVVNHLLRIGSKKER